MKLALVGIGKIALDQHAPALAASPDWDLAATVSRKGTVPGVQSFTDFGQMLADRPDIPVISLCLPPVPRFAYARAALDAGRHVMLEKPPGATLAECQTLIQLAEAQDLTLFCTWHSRAAAMVEPARIWLADKRLVRLHVTWKEDVRRWHPGQDWIWEPGGMGVFDPGINALSIVTRILPDPIHVSSAHLSVPVNRQAPIAADLTFAHPGGAEVTAAFDWRQTGPQTWAIDADTEDGTLSLQDGGARLWIDGQDVTEAQLAGKPAIGEYPQLYAEMAGLLARRASDTDLSPLCHVADAFMLGRRDMVAPFLD